MKQIRPRIIAVFGGSRAASGSAEYEEAYTLGKLLARAGFIVMNGGYAGTMEASARGAKEEGGRTIGILSEEFGWLDPNPYLDEVERSQDLFARIRAMQQRADGFIVLKGSMGTLAELALVWNLAKIDSDHRKPILLLGDAWREVLRVWRAHLAVTEDETDLLRVVATPEQAAEFLARCFKD
jgi:hypothetical protein